MNARGQTLPRRVIGVVSAIPLRPAAPTCDRCGPVSPKCAPKALRSAHRERACVNLEPECAEPTAGCCQIRQPGDL